MERLKGWLDKGLKQLVPPEVLAAGTVFASWGEIVGPAISLHAQPRGLRQGVLLVEVASAAWAQELQLLKPRILQALNSRQVAIRDVRFQVAGRRERAERDLAARQPEAPLARGAADPAARARIAEVLAGVGEPQLARALAAALEAAQRRSAAQQRAGYHACAACGLPLPPAMGERCPSCRS